MDAVDTGPPGHYMKGSRRRGFWTSRGYVQPTTDRAGRKTSHRKALGAAAYGTFLWFLAMQSGDDGAVNYGRPILIACSGPTRLNCCVSHDLQISRSQALRDFKRLRTTLSPSTGEPYLLAKRRPQGYEVTVNRQKKFAQKLRESQNLPRSGKRHKVGSEVSQVSGQRSSTSERSRSIRSDTSEVSDPDLRSLTCERSHLITDKVLHKEKPARDPNIVAEGHAAYRNHLTLNHVPYTTAQPEFRDWKLGWRQAQEESCIPPEPETSSTP